MGDDEVAYSVAGNARTDLLHIPGLLNHLESAAEEPALARHYDRLASIARLVMFDRRGTGLSSPLRRDRPLTLEERADEALAVLDAAGVERAAVHATADGVPVAVFLAGAHPERVSALSLYAASARTIAAPGYPEGLDADLVNGLIDEEFKRWGDDDRPAAGTLVVPSRADDPAVMRSLARMERLAGTPTMARRFWDLAMATDVRDILSSVRVPTLVTHCTGDLLIPIAQGRYVAEQIEGSRFVEIDGTDHFYFWDGGDRVIAELERFLTGARAPVVSDRVLATVLFTDIVGSTDRAVVEGDERWRHLLERHDAMTEAQITASGGERVKTTGDGVLAVFDAPTRAIGCALGIAEDAEAMDLQIRAGVHTGELERRGDGDIAGIAVHVAARVMAHAAPSQVLVSRTVSDLIAGSGIALRDAGEHELKGVPGRWQLLAVG
jgi:class 3 adenylate cyclase